nr:EFR1 family ferrodoxin [bacterium]
MILYFTGTGNSRYIAQRIAKALGDELVSMNDRIKAGETSPITSDARLVIVTPTYAWRIPRIVRDHLAETHFPCGALAWFVMTCGSEIGHAAGYNRALCQIKQLAYMGTAQIIMPENYIAMFNAPQAEEARQIVARAEPAIDRAASAIKAGQEFSLPRHNLYDRFMSGPVNPIFYSFFVKATAFTAGSTCTGCGQCARLCPTNNITLQNGKPVWGGGCTHCMACICRCPTQAIEYGKKSLGKPRYHFDAL